MHTDETQEEAVEMLQQLGLKEYEAKCFVALSRVPKATAKEISTVADVPRTRVYDANRILEAKGLVEVQHTNPQQFRAVPIEEAMATLRDGFESRMETLQQTLEDIEPAEMEGESLGNEVWSLTGQQAIQNRTQQLIDDGTGEVVLVVGSEEVLSDPLFDSLREAVDRNLSVFVGTLTSELQAHVEREVPDATVFVSGLEWLRGGGPSSHGADDTAIGRLLLVDRQAILVSSIDPENAEEHVVFGRGFGNGLVVIIRRLMSTGLFEGLQKADD
ncbi:TrmB family transcriptional regulator [Halorientalis salina]|uniref:TrmB family transcriptional regulator n=1 Tax=Halorientalis salina TaxID=2932266 RepID=UPI0010ACA462|nr:helix-turn-helix domain-containing protein [Halorientalis salina]